MALHVLFLIVLQGLKLIHMILYHEKTLTLHNAIIRIEAAFYQDQNHYYYNILLEKCSYQLAISYCTKTFEGIVMLRFGKTKIVKQKVYSAKKPIKILMLILIILSSQKLVESILSI